MSSKSKVKNALITSLNSDYALVINLFLEGLIERKVFGDGLEQYRVYDKNADKFITSKDELIAAISEDRIEYGEVKESGNTSGEYIIPVYVIPTNLSVTLNRHSNEDYRYLSKFGDSSAICFYMTYMNDLDTTFPLKVFNVKLV